MSASLASSSTTTLPFFDTRGLEPLKVYAFFGKRGGGKTTMMREVIYHLRHHFTEVYVFSATEDCNETWSQHCPSTFVYNGFFPEKLAAIIERQRKRWAAYKASLKTGRPLPCPHTLIVAEDLMAEKKKYVNDPSVRTLHMNGRHMGITLCETVQYLIDLPPGLRNNLDYCFMMKENSDRNMKNAHDNWASMACEISEFKDIMREATKKYGVLVIETSKDPEECLSWYRAPAAGRGDFRVGSRAFWAFHFRHGKGRGAAAAASAQAQRPAALESTIGLRRRPTKQGRTLRLLGPKGNSKNSKNSKKTSRRIIRE